MTTVIFVHGTGVRGQEYEETFQTIEKKIHAQRSDVKVERCLWGDELGTSLLAKGASIPKYDETLALALLDRNLAVPLAAFCKILTHLLRRVILFCLDNLIHNSGQWVFKIVIISHNKNYKNASTKGENHEHPTQAGAGAIYSNTNCQW